MLALSSLLLLCPLHGHPEPFLRTSSQARGDEAVYNISLLLIERIVDDAEPADEQPGLALEFDTYTPGSIGWELGLSSSSDEATASGFGDFEATVSEAYGGVRKTWGAAGQRFHPYLGGGLSFVQAEAELSGFGSEDDSSFGVYAHGGAYWTFGHFNLGADLKTLAGTDLEFGDADYLQLGVILGYSI